jgi:hypothetical protein
MYRVAHVGLQDVNAVVIRLLRFLEAALIRTLIRTLNRRSSGSTINNDSQSGAITDSRSKPIAVYVYSVAASAVDNLVSAALANGFRPDLLRYRMGTGPRARLSKCPEF